MTAVGMPQRPVVRRVFHAWCVLGAVVITAVFAGLQWLAPLNGLVAAVALGQLAIAGAWS